MHSPIPEQVMDGLHTTEQSDPKHPSMHEQVPVVGSHVPIPEQSFGQDLLPALTAVHNTWNRVK